MSKKPTQYTVDAFRVDAITNPHGYAQGVYYFVAYLGSGEYVKVSRYLKWDGTTNSNVAAIAHEKADRYRRKYEAGDRNWPAVTRADELRDSDDVIALSPDEVAYLTQKADFKFQRELEEQAEKRKEYLGEYVAGVEFTRQDLADLFELFYTGVAGSGAFRPGQSLHDFGQLIKANAIEAFGGIAEARAAATVVRNARVGQQMGYAVLDLKA